MNTKGSNSGLETPSAIFSRPALRLSRENFERVNKEAQRGPSGHKVYFQQRPQQRTKLRWSSARGSDKRSEAAPFETEAVPSPHHPSDYDTAVCERARTLQFLSSDAVKQMNSALRLSEVFRERNAQLILNDTLRSRAFRSEQRQVAAFLAKLQEAEEKEAELRILDKQKKAKAIFNSNLTRLERCEDPSLAQTSKRNLPEISLRGSCVETVSSTKPLQQRCLADRRQNFPYTGGPLTFQDIFKIWSCNGKLSPSYAKHLSTHKAADLLKSETSRNLAKPEPEDERIVDYAEQMLQEAIALGRPCRPLLKAIKQYKRQFEPQLLVKPSMRSQLDIGVDRMRWNEKDKNIV